MRLVVPIMFMVFDVAMFTFYTTQGDWTWVVIWSVICMIQAFLLGLQLEQSNG